MKQKKCKIIFFGTPEFAVPTLKALINAPFCDVVKVVTQPDKPVGRHHSKLVPSPVKKVAEEAGLTIVHEIPPLASTLGRDGAMIGILVAYGEIIPKKIIDSFPLGILNLHPSLLPKYRGSSPIQAAILNQDKETGVTIMKLDHKMDHGPIVAQKSVKLNQTETTGELSNILAQVGADLLIKILPDYIAGKITPKAQDDSKASFTKKLTKQDGKIDFKNIGANRLTPYEPIIRAMNPWPGAWTIWNGKKLVIWRTSADKTHCGDKIAAVRSTFPRNDILIEEVQIEGKKKMPYSEFLKGHPDFKITDCD